MILLNGTLNFNKTHDTNYIQIVNTSSLRDKFDDDKNIQLTRTDCDEAGDYVVPYVLSPRDLVFRPY